MIILPRKTPVKYDNPGTHDHKHNRLSTYGCNPDPGCRIRSVTDQKLTAINTVLFRDGRCIFYSPPPPINFESYVFLSRNPNDCGISNTDFRDDIISQDACETRSGQPQTRSIMVLRVQPGRRIDRNRVRRFRRARNKTAPLITDLRSEGCRAARRGRYETSGIVTYSPRSNEVCNVAGSSAITPGSLISCHGPYGECAGPSSSAAKHCARTQTGGVDDGTDAEDVTPDGRHVDTV